MKKQYNNFVEVERMIQFLQWQEVTTKRQKNKGTREFKLPINDPYGDAIHVASYSSGYVRRTRVRSCWQLNKTKKNYEKTFPNGSEWWSIERILIPNEQDRLEYLISYCLKNYYIGQANMLSNGEYIPKWKHESYKSEYRNRVTEVNNPEVKVMVNGHRYNVSEWFK